MKIWLDDMRPPPDENWEWHKNGMATGDLLYRGIYFDEISFDHDLGGSHTSIPIAELIEAGAYNGTIPRIVWHIHSMNPVGAANLRRILERADRFWAERESSTGHL